MPGYEMATIDLGFRPVTDSLNLGTIALRRLADVKGHTVSVTTLAAPKKAKRSYDKAVQELRNKRPNPQKAAKELEKAVREHPEFAAAWHLLGRIRERRRDVEGALQAFEKALVADPTYLSPYLPLLRTHLEQGRWQRAAALADQTLKLNPHLIEARLYHAVAYYYLGEIDTAERSAQAVLAAPDSTNYPQIHQVLGMLHAKKGDYPSAATEYRSFLAVRPEGPVAEDLRRQLLDWQALGVIVSSPTLTTTPSTPY